MELGIYIHIPFCIKKCDYCDFISYSNCFEMQEKYVEKLLEEIEENRQLLKNNFISTIYIGGGTPSAIKPELIKRILDKIYEIIGIVNEKIEITIEVNPGTTTKNNLQMYRNCGINRLSIGLQSTNDSILKEIGRIHNYNQFLDTYKWANEVGFENINVDLMIGLPEQDIEILKDSLENVVNLKPSPKHISVYSLIVEEGTKIEQKINCGEMKLPNDEEERRQYHYMKNFLELNGYKHYEISNFAKPGYESKHNMNCWEQKQYVGFGVAAHSYVNGIRYANMANLEEYLNVDNEKNIENYMKNDFEVDFDNKNGFETIKNIEETQNKIDMEKEFMMLGLRKIDGISISKFEEKFGENPIYLFRNELQKLVEEDLLEVDLDDIRLTRKGLDLANLVWEEFV
ncbi:MAG: radical SAM family heme chaperone HemW [Clostridia bacterium]